MSVDDKFFMFLCVCAVTITCAITAGISYSNYLFTMRQKDCISAGYEWIHLPNFSEMDCRKVSK
jgi:hypothetical protein